ncbi:hypothetical protein AMAG_19115 [Allomyces macrogynus ATCC 38327]|uniref:PIPK domain-containing protein n=1 Tax=Allomyces macrogynus (strain ATCC 38327) TaxID=578462 RepID=A0A0L0SP45_ALLM3|nr:hypothetical protein AMAG_19115 [Allomyces macrogynus ATCC 38327]|eukprot:KNE64140.1 hypothetical protein AMAG_19115 [Allomyces macrogynus ATCC 38327]
MVFRKIRTAFGLTASDYLSSLTGKYIMSELSSPGRSGSYLYYSHDYSMIIKSIHHAEQKLLLKILPDYVEYISKNPNTLLARYYGLHRMKIPGQQKPIHFVVMRTLPTGKELEPSQRYDFKFKDYCPMVFRKIRTAFGLTASDYLSSLTGKYIMSELSSPGRSGSYLYYSHDYSMIIKSIHHAEQKLLLKILPDYVEYISKNPNTLLARYYGLHRMKIPGQQKPIHFVVMVRLHLADPYPVAIGL